MLGLWLASGIVPFDLAAGTGAVSVPPERVATVVRAQASTVIGNAIPQGAPVWTQPFDPADHAQYVMSWDAFLAQGVQIAEVLSISMSAAGAALGVGVDRTPRFAPIVDSSGRRRVRMYFTVPRESQGALQFDAAGTRLPVTCKIRTNDAIPEEFERAAVLVVRQA